MCEWKQKKNSSILGSNWSDGPWSFGKIRNLGKPYFLDLSLNCVSEVNPMIRHGGIPLVRKAMIRFGLALNTNNCWEITQLFQCLEHIIQRYAMESHEEQSNKQNFKISNTQALLSTWALADGFSVLQWFLHFARAKRCRSRLHRSEGICSAITAQISLFDDLTFPLFR